MARIVPTITPQGVGVLVVWAGVLPGDTCEWFSNAHRWPEKTFHITGTVGTSTYALQGASDPADPQTLKDAENIAITQAGARLGAIRDNPANVRPAYAAGGTGTALAFRLDCSR